MRRADRLLDLVARLKAKPLVRADDLADAMETSVRTVYRDIAALQTRGLPIEGQAGVGYMLRGDVDLPPLSFGHDQLDAIALGLSFVEQVGDPDLVAAAQDARAKIDAAWAGQPTPPPSQRRLRARQLFEQRAPRCAALIRKAIRTTKLLGFIYQDAQRRRSERMVHPLALTTYAHGWLLISWCPDRNDFRVFRLDRMEKVAISATGFAEQAGRDLATYLKQRH
jgi:predicted DNA-binding transcriptional regulator YafY